jgi:hypothetical protein
LAALPAAIEHHTLECRTRSVMPDYNNVGLHAVAKLSYAFAAAMLKERATKSPSAPNMVLTAQNK